MCPFWRAWAGRYYMNSHEEGMSSVTVSSVTYSTRERVYRVATAAGKAPSTQAISTMVRRYSLQTHNWSTGPRETRLERSQGVRGSWGQGEHEPDLHGASALRGVESGSGLKFESGSSLRKSRSLRDPDSVPRVPIRCFERRASTPKHGGVSCRAVRNRGWNTCSYSVGRRKTR